MRFNIALLIIADLVLQDLESDLINKLPFFFNFITDMLIINFKIY